MGKGVWLGVLLLILPLSVSADGGVDGVETTVADNAVADSTDSAVENNATVVAYYFHGDRRCATCQKLEAYSAQAISEGFAGMLEDSSLVWRVVNFDEEDNQHFAKDYQLYSQAVILSRRVDGQQTEWVNLDKIWELVGDKEAFMSYIRKETQAFLAKTQK